MPAPRKRGQLGPQYRSKYPRINAALIRQRRRMGTVAAFAPTDVAGLVAWYDFSDATTLFTDTGRTTPVASDGDSILGVTDLSGTGNHLSCADTTPGKYYTAVLNGNSIIRFTLLTNQETGASNGAISQPDTWFIVFKAASSATNRIIDNTSGAARQLVGYSGGAYQLYAGSSATTGTVDTNSHVIRAVFNDSSSILAVDGSVLSSSLATGTNGIQNLSLCHVDNGAGGDIGEVLLYNSSITGADATDVEGYLQSKWGTP
jgi:hypothetical protein